MFIYLGLIGVMRNRGRGAGSGLCKQGSAKARGIGGSSGLKARADARLYAASANETKTSLPVGSCVSMKPK